jgi:hypothetical protein
MLWIQISVPKAARPKCIWCHQPARHRCEGHFVRSPDEAGKGPCHNGMVVCDRHKLRAEQLETMDLLGAAREGDAVVEKWIRQYLGSERLASIIVPLAEVLHSDDLVLQERAIRILRTMQTVLPSLLTPTRARGTQAAPNLIRALTRSLDSPSETIACEALRLLCRLAKDDYAAARDAVSSAAGDARPEIREIASRFLPELRLPGKRLRRSRKAHSMKRGHSPQVGTVTPQPDTPVDPTCCRPDWWRERGE